MLITVGHVRICGLQSDTKVSTEAQKSTDTHSPATNSPKIVGSQTSDPLLMTELPLMGIVTAGQMTHGQDDDAAADVTEAHVVRADTEHVLGDANHVAERTSLGNHNAWTPHFPRGRSPSKSLTTSKACPTWRAHHQDFYASKWFRTILIFIIFSVIAVALVLYLFVSPPLNAYIDVFSDLFDFTLLLLPAFLSPVGILLLVVLGGMRWSKIFQ